MYAQVLSVGEFAGSSEQSFGIDTILSAYVIGLQPAFAVRCGLLGRQHHAVGRSSVHFPKCYLSGRDGALNSCESSFFLQVTDTGRFPAYALHTIIDCFPALGLLTAPRSDGAHIIPVDNITIAQD